MTGYAFVGFGELGAQIAGMLDLTGESQRQVVFDDIACLQGLPGARPFLDYVDNAYADYAFYVCLGYKHLERKLAILEHLAALGRSIPPLCAPSAFLNRSAALGQGVAIYPMCNIDKGAVVEGGSLLNNSVVVSHDCRVGRCCYLSPGVILAGRVSIGDCTFIGAGATIANNVSIGRGVTVGIGTVVTANVPDGASVIGNPMRVLHRKLRIE